MSNKVYYGEYSLKHWIDLILSKNITLPEYQRSFVWSKEQVKRLIQAFEKDLYVPPVTVGAFIQEGENLNLVLDGQQRLTSILLAYLNVYPNKNTFKEINNNEPIYSSNDNFDSDGSDDESDTIIKWTFNTIQENGKTYKERKEYILNNESQYPKLDIGIELNDEFLNNHYLGFSFLVPDSIQNQNNYYASVFREINIGGTNLLPQESREALYHLNKSLKEFFDPKFTGSYTIKTKNIVSKMDFVRYLSVLSQYKHDGKENNIGKGTGGILENYYTSYIDDVIQNAESDKFGKFSDVFPSDDDWKSRINRISESLNKLEPNKNFDSIISIDMVMFGLIYFVLFENKAILDQNINELNAKIKQASDDFRKIPKHSKAPNSFKYLRERVAKSINIYREFINESA